MKKIVLGILGITILTFITYFMFFRIDWKLIKSGNVEEIQKHLKYKTKLSLNSTNSEGYSLFNEVLRTTSNYDNYELVKFLVEKDLKKKKMISPYESIVDGLGDTSEEKLQKLMEIGKLLKNSGFNEIKRDRSLLKALEKKDYKLFETLLKMGVDVNQTNDLGETCIFYIIKEQYKYNNELFVAMNKLGLQELPNKNILSELFIKDERESYNNELMIIKKAMEFYDMPIKILDFLNRYGANPNIANTEGITPLGYSFEKNNKIYVKKLFNFKNKISFKDYGNYKVIFDGILRADKEILNQIYKNRVDLYHKNEKNETLLNFIIREEKFYILEELLKRKILTQKHIDYIFKYYLEEEDMKTLKKINLLGIMLSNPQEVFEEKLNKYKKIDIMVYLVDLNVDLNAKNKMGDTALLSAIKRENETLFNLFILRGADINATDKDGNSPLIIATKMGNLYFVQELINRGAKLDIKNNIGQDVIFFSKNNSEINKILNKQSK